MQLMREISLPPAAADRTIARFAARHTTPGIQKAVRVITCAADEHLVCAAAVAAWMLSRLTNRPERAVTDHLLATVAASAALPHLIKKMVDQERPDRCMVGVDRRGVETSGKPRDAFPSGHGVHIGAVASALSWMYPRRAPLIWAIGGTLAASRVAVLAHWPTDVLAGLAMGVAVEKLLRPAPARLSKPGLG
jgi:undecaprenyl-diphosphatase